MGTWWISRTRTAALIPGERFSDRYRRRIAWTSVATLAAAVVFVAALVVVVEVLVVPVVVVLVSPVQPWPLPPPVSELAPP
jgi:multisubunit Na+/H+ antiporter MnhG subunit